MPILKHLIADTFGTHIGKYSKRLKITQNGQTLAQAPLLHLEAVSVVSNGVSISADALKACCEHGIPIFFIDPIGTPYASIYAAGLGGTVITRREQLRAYDDWRGTAIGIAFAMGKIKNQAATLRYLARNRQDLPEGKELSLCAGEVLDYLTCFDQETVEPIETMRSHILPIEGNAAKLYWKAVRHIIPEEYGWTGRVGRGATDPINSLLNYGYGILYGHIERTLTLAGLDPYAGFVHADRPGKPSLVLDFIEEYRSPIVDRVVFGLATRNYSVEQEANGLLTQETRRDYADKILDKLESSMRYKDNKRYPFRAIIQTQARHLAAFLRGECERYIPFKAEA